MSPDAVVLNWRPSKAESKPPVHPTSDKYCWQCEQERNSKQPWDLTKGFAEEHLELLSATSTIAECMDWWQVVSSIQWDIQDELKLARKYVERLAKMNAKQIWGTDSRVLSLTKYLPKGKPEPANDEWFLKNSQNVPTKQKWMRNY